MRLALIALAIFAGNVHAATGSDLLQRCEQAEQFMNDTNAPVTPNVSRCLSYTLGFIDGNMYTEARTKRRAFCAPDEATTGQHVRVALKYLRENPADLHQPAAWLFGEAFRKAYPCR